MTIVEGSKPDVIHFTPKNKRTISWYSDTGINYIFRARYDSFIRLKKSIVFYFSDQSDDVDKLVSQTYLYIRYSFLFSSNFEIFYFKICGSVLQSSYVHWYIAMYCIFYMHLKNIKCFFLA